MSSLKSIIAISSGKVLVCCENDKFRLPTTQNYPSLIPALGSIFEFGGYMAFEDTKCSEGGNFRGIAIRESATILPAEDYQAIAKASELLHWNSQSRFCGCCGGRMQRASAISKKCDDCGLEIFPQLSPAVLVLVTRGERALLVHARNFTRPFFGLVAGFVETGESLEECVVREVKEETSLCIKNVRYFGSQTWPFPANLMIGFTAEYESGEIDFADNELSEGGFFSRDNLPEIPSPPSLARTMIEAWIKDDIG